MFTSFNLSQDEDGVWHREGDDDDDDDAVDDDNDDAAEEEEDEANVSNSEVDISLYEERQAQLRACLPPAATAHAHNRPHSSSQVIIVDQDYGGGGSPSSFNNADYHQQVSPDTSFKK